MNSISIQLYIFDFLWYIKRNFPTLTSSSRPSSWDLRSSISDSKSSTDWLVRSLSNLFFNPGLVLFKNPFWLLESAFNCLLASLTRIMILSLSLIFWANCLFSSWAWRKKRSIKILRELDFKQGKEKSHYQKVHKNLFLTCFILCFNILVSSLWACNKLGSSPWAPTRRSKALPCLLTRRFKIRFSSFRA